MSATRLRLEAWLCTDCMMAAHGMPLDPCCTAPDHKPLSAVEAGDRLLPGLLREWHAPDCDPTVECDCETLTFSYARCDGCNTQLAGQRHGFTQEFGAE